MNAFVSPPEALALRTAHFALPRAVPLPPPRYVGTGLRAWCAQTPLPLPSGDSAGWTALLSYFGLGALWLPRVKKAAGLRGALRRLHAALGAPYARLPLPSLLALPVPAAAVSSALCGLARHGEPRVRATALLLCVLRPVPDAEALLLCALRDRERVVREAAVVALGHGYAGRAPLVLVDGLARAAARADSDRQFALCLDTIDRLDVWEAALPTLRQEAEGERASLLDAVFESLTEGEASGLRAWLAYPDASMALVGLRFLRGRPALLAACAPALEALWSQGGGPLGLQRLRAHRMEALRCKARRLLAALRSHASSPGDGWVAEVEALLTGDAEEQALGCAAAAQSPELARAMLPHLCAVMRASLPSLLVCDAALGVLVADAEHAEAARVLFGAARPHVGALRRAARLAGPTGRVFAQLLGWQPADASLVALAGAATHPRIARVARLGLSLVAPDTVVPALTRIASSRAMTGPARRNAAACAMLADHDAGEAALTHRMLLLRGARLPGESRAPMVASLAGTVGFDALLAPHAMSLLEGIDAPGLAPVAPMLRAVAEATPDAALRQRIGALFGTAWEKPASEEALAAAMGCPSARVALGEDTPSSVRAALWGMYGGALYGDDAERASAAHRSLAALDEVSLRRDLVPALQARLADTDEDCQRVALRVLAGLAEVAWTEDERAGWAETLRSMAETTALRREVAAAMEAWGLEPRLHHDVSPEVRRLLRRLDTQREQGMGAACDDDSPDAARGGGGGGSGTGRMSPRHLIRF